jgi:hypothetical protein
MGFGSVLIPGCARSVHVWFRIVICCTEPRSFIWIATSGNAAALANQHADAGVAYYLLKEAGAGCCCYYAARGVLFPVVP